jgi:hypothetical protein
MTPARMGRGRSAGNLRLPDPVAGGLRPAQRTPSGKDCPALGGGQGAGDQRSMSGAGLPFGTLDCCRDTWRSLFTGAVTRRWRCARLPAKDSRPNFMTGPVDGVGHPACVTVPSAAKKTFLRGPFASPDNSSDRSSPMRFMPPPRHSPPRIRLQGYPGWAFATGRAYPACTVACWFCSGNEWRSRKAYAEVPGYDQWGT